RASWREGIRAPNFVLLADLSSAQEPSRHHPSLPLQTQDKWLLFHLFTPLWVCGHVSSASTQTKHMMAIVRSAKAERSRACQNRFPAGTTDAASPLHWPRKGPKPWDERPLALHGYSKTNNCTQHINSSYNLKRDFWPRPNPTS
ncbi:hypothetical protein JZ751_017453, partial [Albula glossodonta]